ncbi:MAG: phytanoyl-CoA dioxygenase family protein [Acidimicrobiales bacterium]
MDLVDLDRFHDLGYAGPFEALSPEETAATRDAVASLLATAPDPYPERGFHARQVPYHHNRFLDSPIAFELSTHPEIVARVRALLGPDVLLWRAHFFDKGPGAKEIPWHQDANYWPLEPAVIVSAWLALDRVTAENSCLQLIPGSHRRIVPHVAATDDMAFLEMAEPGSYDPSHAIDIDLEPGQFILFNERILHHSEPNRSILPRCGLSIRFIPPLVKVLTYDSQNHVLPVVSGEDRLGFNRTLGSPTDRLVRIIADD